MPELLNVLDIQGCFVTIDAMRCQTKIATLIDEMDGYYVFDFQNASLLAKITIRDMEE